MAKVKGGKKQTAGTEWTENLVVAKGVWKDEELSRKDIKGGEEGEGNIHRVEKDIGAEGGGAELKIKRKGWVGSKAGIN